MKYKKKPSTIEAIQYHKDKIGEALDFCSQMKYDPESNEYYIQTLEGSMLVSEGDYIIKGVAGEFYPCKPDIFERIYDPV